MGALSRQRDQLATDLRVTGLDVHAAWPPRLAPPCVVLVPATPWIDAVDCTFHERRTHLSVHVIAGAGEAGDGLAVLEEAVESVLHHSEDWAVQSVDAPTLVSVSGAEYLATTLNINKPFRLTPTR